MSEINKYTLIGMMYELKGLLQQVNTLQHKIYDKLNEMDFESKRHTNVNTNVNTNTNSFMEDIINFSTPDLPTIGNNFIQKPVDQVTTGMPSIFPQSQPIKIIDDPNVKINNQDDNKKDLIVDIDSFNDEDMKYHINVDKGTCSCPHFIHRGPLKCKHIEKILSKPGDYGLSGNVDLGNLNQLPSPKKIIKHIIKKN